MSAHDDTAAQQLGARIRFNGHEVLAGSCSWTDRALVEQGRWYPRRTMSAAERLRFYAEQFPLTEVTPPTTLHRASSRRICGQS
jgi:hypothetical protein